MTAFNASSTFIPAGIVSFCGTMMKNPDVSKDVITRLTDAAVTLLGEIVESSLPAGFASSFGAEDMVLLDLIANHARQIEVFTLDTGRLPEETYRLMSEVRERYPVPVRVFCSETDALETYIERNGPDAFYQSVGQRRECCHIRKVEPLGRALEGKKSPAFEVSNTSHWPSDTTSQGFWQNSISPLAA